MGALEAHFLFEAGGDAVEEAGGRFPLLVGADEERADEARKDHGHDRDNACREAGPVSVTRVYGDGEATSDEIDRAREKLFMTLNPRGYLRCVK